MSVVREPSPREEKQIAARACHLKALLDSAREAGMAVCCEYGWDEDRPAEPRVVIAGVSVYADGVDDADYVIGRHGRRVSVTRIDLALRAIRAIASGSATREPDAKGTSR